MYMSVKLTEDNSARTQRALTSNAMFQTDEVVNLTKYPQNGGGAHILLASHEM